MNETIKVNGEVLCSNCFDTRFPEKKDLEGKLVEKELDPTICAHCSADQGDTELNKLSRYPTCEECFTRIRNKAFPKWVKAFFAAVIILVLIGFAWNWRYYQAYTSFNKSMQYFKNGDLENAAARMRVAAEKAPDVADLQGISAYFNGIQFLSQDKSAEALKEFYKCQGKIPADMNLDKLIIQARIGASFDNKDYEGFLEASKDNLAIDSTLPVNLSSVASAYACIYADKGDETAKNNALSFLNRAKAIDDTSAEMKQYYNVIEYRLDSKNIITRDQFNKQFPNGWTKTN